MGHNILEPITGPPSSTVASTVTPELFPSIVYEIVGHRRLRVTSIVSSIVISKYFIYNTGRNKCKELLSTKLQFKVEKNPTWRGSWMLLNALFLV